MVIVSGFGGWCGESPGLYRWRGTYRQSSESQAVYILIDDEGKGWEIVEKDVVYCPTGSPRAVPNGEKLYLYTEIKISGGQLRLGISRDEKRQWRRGGRVFQRW